MVHGKTDTVNSSVETVVKCFAVRRSYDCSALRIEYSLELRGMVRYCCSTIVVEVRPRVAGVLVCCTILPEEVLCCNMLVQDSAEYPGIHHNDQSVVFEVFERQCLLRVVVLDGNLHGLAKRVLLDCKHLCSFAMVGVAVAAAVVGCDPFPHRGPRGCYGLQLVLWAHYPTWAYAARNLH